MVNRSWPLDAVSGAPVYSGRALRQTQVAPLVAGASVSRPLGGRSGVRPGTSLSFVTATSTTWTVGAHAGILDVQAAAEAGPYGYSVDASVSGSVSAANASNPRVDIVFVQLADPAESDGTSTPGVTVGYLAGSAAASPVAPAAPARSMVLSQIVVPKSGSGSPSVTFVAPFAVAAGGQGSFNTVADMNAALGASAPGEVAYCLATDVTYRRSNSGTLRWIRLAGGTFVGTRQQTIGNGAVSNLGAFNRDATFSDRDDFFTSSSNTLIEGDYVVSLTMGLSGVSGTGRNFVGVGGGGSAARNGFGAGEDTVTVATAMHMPAGGGSLTLQAFLTVASSPNSPNFRLQISKVG
jgi:hypothetical protein